MSGALVVPEALIVEAARHLRAVAEHDADAVVAADAERVQARQRVGDEAAQAAVVEAGPAGRGERDGVVGAGGEQLLQGL